MKEDGGGGLRNKKSPEGGSGNAERRTTGVKFQEAGERNELSVVATEVLCVLFWHRKKIHLSDPIGHGQGGNEDVLIGPQVSSDTPGIGKLSGTINKLFHDCLRLNV